MAVKLRPSARIKRRYLLIEANNKEEIEEALLEAIGNFGWAKAKPVFVNVKGKTILSISREHLDGVRAAFEIYGKRIVIKKVSGTLKGLA